MTREILESVYRYKPQLQMPDTDSTLSTYARVIGLSYIANYSLKFAYYSFNVPIIYTLSRKKKQKCFKIDCTEEQEGFQDMIFISA